MKQRKIVQVAAFPLGPGPGARLVAVAVADDGSAWKLNGDKWNALPPLPPIEEPEGEEGK